MKIKTAIVFFAMTIIFIACKTNPFTGERNLNFVSNEQIFPVAFQQYDEFLAQHQVVEGTRESQMVKNVGRQVATAAERFLNAQGYTNYLDDYRWEFSLIQDETVNAWALPGGKIAVYTGIMPIAQDETGVAVIMAHEVAHALADHGAQRMSAAQLNQVVGSVGAAVIGGSEQTQQIFAAAYGLGSEVGVMLPFSRSHENEADRIGLTIMAIAGYDPAEAANLWRRMQEHGGGQSPPEFLSTHPSNETRIRNLTQWAPEAKEEARKFGVTSFK